MTETLQKYCKNIIKLLQKYDTNITCKYVHMYYIVIFTHFPSQWTLPGLSLGWHLWMIPWPSWFSAWVVFLPIVSLESSWVQTLLGEKFFFHPFFQSTSVFDCCFISKDIIQMLSRYYWNVKWNTIEIS